MNAALFLIIGCAVLVVGYIFYGGWLAKKWGVDNSRPTPAHTMEDGKDYCPAKAPVLMGHHFSSIAGAGPINGPIQAAVFGWVPVMLWVLIGGIFFGGVHDFGALFASIRHKGESIGEVIGDAIGAKAKKLFITFAYLTLILVVAAFASIVANTFKATYTADGAVDYAASAANASTAIISIMFILMAIIFGFFVYRRNAPLGISTIIGVIGIVVCMVIGLNWHPIYLSYTVWMIIVGLYIGVASVTPVWILLQPRDYLSSFLLYGMMILAVVGIIGAHPIVDMPAFLGFEDTLKPTGTSLGYMFPALFVTIACGAVSGFHSLVGSGTTSKQLDQEKDAKPIAYGGMLIECALALISVCAVGYIWKEYAAGTTVTPTVVFATGLASMFSKVFGSGCYNVVYSMLILAVSAFCLTSVDTATRLARYMFAEFFVEPGKTREDHLFPIIMLTAKVEDMDKIMGLTLGADDYITKPFNPLELVARVKTQLRRYTRYNPREGTVQEVTEYDFRGLQISKATHKCVLFGEELALTPLEFSILWYLCEHRGNVVSSEELFEHVWGEAFMDSNNTVMSHIARLREKMHEPSRKPKFIKTVWGVGYTIE